MTAAIRPMAPLVAVLTLAVLALAAAPAAGQAPAAPEPSPSGLTASAQRIESLLAEGRGPEATAAARDFLRAVSQSAGFGVTNARLTEGPATGFGVFMPRADNVYRPGEPVHAYVEVYGFTLSDRPDGTRQMLFEVSFTLDDHDGHQVTDALVPMGDVSLLTFSDPVDGYFHLTYRISGVHGAFDLRTHVVDQASGQVAEFTLPIVFAEPEPQRK